MVTSRCQISKPDFVFRHKPNDDHLSRPDIAARLMRTTFFYSIWNKFVLAPSRVCHGLPVARRRVLSLLSREQKPQNTFHLSPRSAGLVLSLWYWSWPNIAIEPVGVTHYHFDGVRTFLPIQKYEAIICLFGI